MALGIVLGCKWNCHQIFWSACFASASYPPWMQGIQRLGRHQFMFAGRLVMAARDRKLSPPLRINQRFISFFSLSLSSSLLSLFLSFYYHFFLLPFFSLSLLILSFPSISNRVQREEEGEAEELSASLRHLYIIPVIFGNHK